MMVVGTPLDDGEEMVGEAVVCGGVDEGILFTVDVVMTAVLLDGEEAQSAVKYTCMYTQTIWNSG